MISSPEPNKITPNSDAKSNSDNHTATLSNQSPPQQEAPDFNRLHLEPDQENLVRDRQKTQHQEEIRRLKGLSVRVKATALAIALGTLPVIVIGATAYFLTNKKITEDVIREQQVNVTSVADSLDQFTLERYKDIQHLSRLSILNNPHVRAVTSAKEKKALLDQYKDTEGYDSIAVADLAGNVLLQSTDRETPTNFSKIDYFQTVLRTNRPVLNPARKSVVTGEYSILVAAPVVDTETGKTIGVVRSLTHVSHLNQMLQAEAKKVGQQTEGIESVSELVLNHEGKVILATAANYLNKDAESIFPQAASQLKASDKVSSVLDISQIDRQKYIVSYTAAGKVDGLPGLNWGVMAVQPTAEAFAANTRLLFTFVIGTGVTTFLVGAIAAYLVNRGTRPILAANAAVEKLGQGKLDTRIAVAGEDEIAMLGSNINLMASQLQTLLQSQADETQRSQLTKDIILRIGQSLTSADILDNLKQSLQDIRLALKTDRVVLYEFDQNWQGTVIAESVGEGWPRAFGAEIYDPCFENNYVERYQKGRIQVTEDIYKAGLT